jgi:hypothetical protein
MLMEMGFRMKRIVAPHRVNSIACIGTSMQIMMGLMSRSLLRHREYVQRFSLPQDISMKLVLIHAALSATYTKSIMTEMV